MDVTVNARPRPTLTVQGGVSTGQTVTDNCEVRAQLPEGSALNPYCHTATGFLPQFRGLAAYTLPRIDVQVAATFQSNPGAQLAANYAVSNAAVVPSLGRNLSGNAPNVTVNLIAPGTLYGDRISQLDIRVAKVLRFGKTRTNVAIDLYNALNSAAVLTYNQAFIAGGAWLTPTSVLSARFAKLSAQWSF